MKLADRDLRAVYAARHRKTGRKALAARLRAIIRRGGRRGA